MARVQNAATSFGAFLDSTLDRYSESIILFGLLWYALQHPGQHDQFWPAPAEQSWMIIFIFLAVVGSFLASHMKARAEGLSIECKLGLLARPERVVILAIGLLSHTGIWALALLVVLTHVTAAERMFAIWQGRCKPSVAHDAATHNAYEISTDNHYSPITAGTNEAKKDRRSTVAHECTTVHRKRAARLMQPNGIRQIQDRTGLKSRTQCYREAEDIEGVELLSCSDFI